jgi:cell division protein FtsZ
MVKEGLINLDFADVRSVMREMGKAMMGTGEASGDRRAIQAAEAAIANPLLDETSMKGARGLLISITGGKDLTLFEVDEAATRIREEVDPEANIILGATFEEELEGIIRVSVVATGIDSIGREETAPLAARTAEMTQRLRSIAQPQPAARPAAQPQPAVAQVVEQAPQVAAKPAVAQAAAAQPKRDTTDLSREAFATAVGRAAAETPARGRDTGITIQPLDPAPVVDYGMADIEHESPAPQEEAGEAASDEPFIPPAPELPPQRIPRVEDFPPVARRAMEAHQQPRQDADRGPMSLLRRLASVGLGRREDDPIGAGAPSRAPERVPPRSAAQPAQSQQRPAHAPVQPRPQVDRATTAQDGLYRPRAGNLDPHGRPQPREGRPADDELEIPAFLRRQAN